MYYLSICCVARNEASYIEEWITFHQFQGVEHFYVYENGSNDNTVKILEKYAKKGIVTLVPYADINPPQFEAYNDCLKYYGTQSKWIAFLDCDEFLNSLTELPLSEELKNNYEAYAGVAVHWIFFGSNGRLTKETGLVTERFTKRAKLPDKHVKSIVQPRGIISVGKNPHTFKIKGKLDEIVDENLLVLPVEYAIRDNPTANKLRINHYHTKSREEYFKRKELPDPGTGVIHSQERLEEMFRVHDLNEVEDNSAAIWAPHIKDILRSET